MMSRQILPHLKLISSGSHTLSWSARVAGKCRSIHQGSDGTSTILSQPTSPSSLTRVMPLVSVPHRCLHVTKTLCEYRVYPRDSFTDVPPTSTHVFHIKQKLPPAKKKKESRPSIVGSLFSTPAPYMLYGLGGLIPFMSAPYYMHVLDVFSPTVAHAQLVYGACILSFLGGVSWGNHLRSLDRPTLTSLRYSILLPLVAWPAVLMYPNPSSFAVLIGGVVYAGMRDVRTKSYPDWFKSLRLLLTTLVALSLSTTLVLSFTKEERGSADSSDDEDSSG